MIFSSETFNVRIADLPFCFVPLQHQVLRGGVLSVLIGQLDYWMQ